MKPRRGTSGIWFQHFHICKACGTASTTVSAALQVWVASLALAHLLASVFLVLLWKTLPSSSPSASQLTLLFLQCYWVRVFRAVFILPQACALLLGVRTISIAMVQRRRSFRRYFSLSQWLAPSLRQVVPRFLTGVWDRRVAFQFLDWCRSRPHRALLKCSLLLWWEGTSMESTPQHRLDPAPLYSTDCLCWYCLYFLLAYQI